MRNCRPFIRSMSLAHWVNNVLKVLSALLRYIAPVLVTAILLSVSILAGCSKDEEYPEGGGTVVTGRVTNSKTGGPLSGVVISDGYSSTVTNRNGVYTLDGNYKARFVYCAVPGEFEIPVKEGVPHFYSKINSLTDSSRVDFELTPLEGGIENEFTLFCVADPQVRNQGHVERFDFETVKDIIDQSAKYPLVYGITLGDLVHDTPELFNDLKQSFVSTGITFFHTIGNHDFDIEATEPLKAAESYKQHFGPVNYSFNRGSAHIVVMNNILYRGGGSYEGGFTDLQIEWLKSNLKYVPKEKLLIISVHIPVLNNDDIINKTRFLEAVKGFEQAHIISGHTHTNANYFSNNYNVWEYVTGTASGIWWRGTINRCGAPNGYGVIVIRGNKIVNRYYKSVRYSYDHQIRVYAPYTFDNTDGYLVANVWNAGPGWKVEFIEEGQNTVEMQQFTGYDPGAYTVIKATGRAAPGTMDASWWYAETGNLFRIKPVNPTGGFIIRATDRFGNEYTEDSFIENIDQLMFYK